MTIPEEPAHPHPLDHPDARAVFDSLFTTLVAESDRGAVLIAAAEVDLQLRKLFERAAPGDMPGKETKRLLDYPGALSSLASRADIAAVAGFIPRHLYLAIGHLRRLRNDVAHSPRDFQLAEHRDRLQGIFEIGPDMPAGINRLALELMLRSFIDRALQIRDPSDESQPAFNDSSEVLEFIAGKPDLVAPFEERRHRWELALGVSLICATIISRREAIAASHSPHTGDGGSTS
jgi:hypothetical protein